MKSMVIDKYSLSIFLMIAAHLAFGILLKVLPSLGWLHTAAVIGLLAYAMLKLKDDKSLILYALAYTCSSEGLWRTAGTVIISELGKYLLALICILLILRSYQAGGKKHLVNPLAFMYIVLLLPAIFLAVNPNLQPQAARIPLIDDIFYFFQLDRQEIAFNLSGPFALSMALAYFDKQKLGRKTSIAMLISLFLPILSLLSLAMYSTYTNSAAIYFGSSSVTITSGGGGPNQVSSFLGLGTLLAVLLVVLIPKRYSLRAGIFMIGALCLVQCVLTFSRGGFWTAIAALVTFAFFLMNNPRFRLVVISLGLLGSFIIVYFVMPTLSEFTDGGVLSRYSDFDTTHRLDYALGELRAFLDYPLTGVGSIEAYHYRERDYNSAGESHTEFTRLLGEHGIAGLVALLLLGIISFNSWRRSRGNLERALKSSFLVWAAVFMSHSAMRLASPALMIALACADYEEFE